MKNKGLCFYVVDAENGFGLDGATFELRQNGEFIRSAISNNSGKVQFGVVFPGVYDLIQTVTPTGYKAYEKIHSVYMDCNNCLCLDGLSKCNFVLKQIKIN